MGGDYEYTFDAAIVLSRPDPQSGLIAAEWAKNRLGKPNPNPTVLRWDQATSSLLELDQAEIDAAETNSLQDSIGPIKNKLRNALRGKPPLSKNAIRELIKADRHAIYAAIESMVAEKTLDQIPYDSGTGFRYSLISRD